MSFTSNALPKIGCKISIDKIKINPLIILFLKLNSFCDNGLNQDSEKGKTL